MKFSSSKNNPYSQTPFIVPMINVKCLRLCKNISLFQKNFIWHERLFLYQITIFNVWKYSLGNEMKKCVSIRYMFVFGLTGASLWVFSVNVFWIYCLTQVSPQFFEARDQNLYHLINFFKYKKKMKERNVWSIISINCICKVMFIKNTS